MSKPDASAHNDKIVSTYLISAFNPVIVKMIIKSFKKAIKNNLFGDFETIAIRGTSGLLIGPILAQVTDKRIIVVRKEEHKAHTSRICEGYLKTQNYIIVDDTIDTGTTIKTIKDCVDGTVKNETDEWPTLKGIFLYSQPLAAEPLRTTLKRKDSDFSNTMLVTCNNNGGYYYTKPKMTV